MSPNSSRTVFISHSRGDAAFARELSRALRERGFAIWFDEDLEVGDARSERLKASLRASSWFVVLLSAESHRSPSSSLELGAALSQGKTILPVLLSNAAEARLPRQLATLSPIQATHLRPSEVADKLIETIEKAA